MEICAVISELRRGERVGEGKEGGERRRRRGRGSRKACWEGGESSRN